MYCVDCNDSLYQTWKDIVKRSSVQNPKMTNRDRVLKRIGARNHKTASQALAVIGIHRQEAVSVKTIRRELHAVNIHGKTGITKPLVTLCNALKR